MPCLAVICTNVDPDNLPPAADECVALHLRSFAVEFGIFGVGRIDFFDCRNRNLMRYISIAVFPFFSLISTIVVAEIAVSGLLGTKQANLHGSWEADIPDISGPNNPAGQLACVAYT